MKKQTLVLAAAFAFAASAVTARAQSSFSNESPAAMQAFGSVVAIGDGEVMVGEPRNLFRSGIVYLYSKEGADWVESGRLTAPEPALQDRFGASLAVLGRTMLVGGNPQGQDSPGVVYAYSRDMDGNWTNTQELRPDDGAPGDGFGTTVFMRDELAFIGAPAHDSTGAVYLFTYADGTWSQTRKLAAGEPATGDRFGAAIMSVDDHLLIGMPGADNRAGAAYHFHRIDGEWTDQGRLPFSANANDRLGSSMSTDGEYFYFGAPGADNNLGSVTAGHFENGRPVASTFRPFDVGRRAGFGSAVAATDNGVWIGTPGSRSVFDFRRSEAGFTSVEKILPGDPDDSRSFGNALAVQGDLAVVGISGGDNGGGYARVYERMDGRWHPSTLLASEQETLNAITGERIDCNAEGHVETWDCSDVDLVSFLPVSEIGGGRGIWLNDLWGWSDEETGREFALVGRIDATAFIEVTDPSHPRYLGELPKTEGARTSVWRDIKVYRNHAYIVADGAGEHGMQVVDLTQLRDIGDEPVTVSEAFHYDNIASAHNIVINEGTGFAYIVGASGGGSTCGGGLHMVDIRNPEHPEFAGCFADTETGRRGTGYSHDAQCLNYTGPDEDYSGKEICIGSNETAISFSDVSDKENPVAISNVSYPNVAYAHQGWLTDDQRYFFSNDEGDEGAGTVEGTRTLIWDVADLDDPILLGEYIAETPDTDHNLYIKGHYMYQSNYGAGLRILDIADPANPVEVGYFDMQPDDASCCSTWSNYPFFKSGVIAVTGGNAGVFFLQKREELVP